MSPTAAIQPLGTAHQTSATVHLGSGGEWCNGEGVNRQTCQGHTGTRATQEPGPQELTYIEPRDRVV